MYVIYCRKWDDFELWTGNGMIVAYFKELFQDPSGETENNDENPWFE
jgi:hypothetical protein